MNPFTKEELDHIQFLAIDRMDAIGLEEAEKEGTASICRKVVDMIDSYCEHEFYLEGSGWKAFAQCHKCGEVSRVERNE